MKKIILTIALILTTSVGYADQQHQEVGTRAIEKTEKMYIKAQNANEEKEERITSDIHHHTGNIMHPGAYHRLNSITSYGESIELEDGSLWSVSWSDRAKTLLWLRDDSIAIYPSNSWLGPDFVIVNLNTNDRVEADLRYGPIYGSIFTYKIVSIDYLNSIVYLQDSTWGVSINDESLLYSWHVGDTVILGHNDGWNTSIRPHILINVNVNDYVCANCISF